MQKTCNVHLWINLWITIARTDKQHNYHYLSSRKNSAEYFENRYLGEMRGGREEVRNRFSIGRRGSKGGFIYFATPSARVKSCGPRPAQNVYCAHFSLLHTMA